MKTYRKWFLLLFLAATVLAFPVSGLEHVEPPEYVVEAVPRGDFFLRRINSKKTVEIRRAKDLKVDWKAAVDDYHAIFSIFRLSGDGKFLVHVKGNDMIHDINQVCVDVYGKSGSRDSYKVNELMPALPKNETRIIGASPYRWYGQVLNVWTDKLIIKLDAKTYAHLSIGTHKVEILVEAEQRK